MRSRLAGLVVVFAMIAEACSSSSATTAPTAAPSTGTGTPTPAASTGTTPAASNITVAVIPKATSIAFFDYVNKGATEASAETGGKVLYNGPSAPNGPDQIPFVTQFANQHVNCISIAGDDPNAVAPALKQARSSGIKVVSYDSDVAKDARDLFVGDATDDDIARTQVKMLAEEMNYQGKFGILSTTPTTTNQNTWITIMKDELTKPAYAKMTLVQTVYGEGVVDKAAVATQGLLKAFPDLGGILAPDVPAGVGAAQEIEKAGLGGKVQLTGLFLPSLMKQYVKDGTVKQFMLYNPSDVGYLTYYACQALVTGQITGKKGDVIHAGKLGDRTLADDALVILGPPTIFTKDNIDQFNF